MRNVVSVVAFVSLLQPMSFAQTGTTRAGNPVSAGASAGKGATPAPQNSKLETQNSTRAVVVGISDYQSSAIPDLNFAHRDAEAFADWLKSPAGGNVPAENIRLLIGEKAKNAQIVADLDGLAENAQAGDLVIIYFSGHGDVETKTRNQFGFLLAWDSPPNNYKAGAYPLIFLQDIVSTISDKKARVVVIADACHAGKLAGSIIGGTQATAMTLAQQFANEVKIMSCQPNELALEGEQWGGGRGAFSFYLLEGLTGLADKNADAAVSLYEIDRYLGDVVPTQTAPHSQIPMVVGDKQFLLSRVDAPSLAALKEMNAGKSGTLATTGGKGFAEGLLADADSALLHLYHDFETALEKGNLLAGSPSANELYALLSKEEKLRPLHGLMRRNLAAALQNEPQQALNALLGNDPYETNNWLFNPQNYETYPQQLTRAIELLGEGHYMRPSLESKKLYFEAYLIARSLTGEGITVEQSDSVRAVAKSMYLEAARLEPSAAYTYYAIENMYQWIFPPQVDSVIWYAEMAIERAPTWVSPYLSAADEMSFSMQNLDEIDRWLTRAQAVQPHSYLVQENLLNLRTSQNRMEEALDICEKMMAEKPDLFNAYAHAGVIYLHLKAYDKAEQFLKKAIELENNPNGNWAFTFLITCFGNTRRLHEANILAESMLADSTVESGTQLQVYVLLGIAAFEAARPDIMERCAELMEPITGVDASMAVIAWDAKMLRGEHEAAITFFNKFNELYPTTPFYNAILYENEALAAVKKGNFARADSLFRKALDHPPGDWNASIDRTYRVTERTRFQYGSFLLQQNRDADARAQFETGIAEEPLGYYAAYGMALHAAKQDKTQVALDWLEKSLDYYYPRKEPILEEPLFKKLRKTKRFHALMAKHFPEHGK